jgi:endonuclease YncB( thermonuclease family)
MRARSLLLWILIVTAIAFAGHRLSLLDRRKPDAPLSGVAHVIDGDSLTIGGARIRLFGIDAPEGRQHCRNARGEDYACGREAARTLERLIGGRAVTCTAVDHDQYERDVATCTVDGRDLSDAMVRAGFARDYTRHSSGRYASAEREAREARRGLWSGEFEAPEQWRRREMMK